ncbi:MAG: hypothetical protein ACYDHY_07070 [Acidiferrobacterales bacterium]
MAIDFESNQVTDLVSEQEFRDIFESLFRGDHQSNPIRLVIGNLPDTGRKHILGLHVFSFGRHEITVDVDQITREFKKGATKMGGNRQAPSVRMAVGLVLAHETQHANQTLQHTGKERFYRARKYKTRGSEMEARTFADDHRKIVAQILGETLPDERASDPIQDPNKAITDVAAALQGRLSTTLDEVVSLLKAVRANNPKNLDRVLLVLKDSKVEIV